MDVEIIVSLGTISCNTCLNDEGKGLGRSLGLNRALF